MQLQWNDCDHEFRFQASLKKYGVPEEEIFQTADLYERRNIPQVTLCIYALARLVSTSSSVSLKLQMITENNQTVGGCSDSETSGVHWSSSGPENGGREQTWVHRRATPCQWRPRGIAGWLQQGRQSSWCRFFRQHSTYVNPSRGRSPGWSWLVQVPTVALIGTDDDDSSSNRFLQWIYLSSSLSLSLLHLSLSLSLHFLDWSNLATFVTCERNTCWFKWDTHDGNASNLFLQRINAFSSMFCSGLMESFLFLFLLFLCRSCCMVEATSCLAKPKLCIVCIFPHTLLQSQ